MGAVQYFFGMISKVYQKLFKTFWCRLCVGEDICYCGVSGKFCPGGYLAKKKPVVEHCSLIEISCFAGAVCFWHLKNHTSVSWRKQINKKDQCCKNVYFKFNNIS